MAMKPIQILINAKDNASSVFSSLQAKIATVGAAVAAYFGVNAFVGVVKGAADFESAMSRVKAATGASASEMAQLGKAAQDAATSTQFTSVEAAGALEELGKTGLSATEAIGALPPIMNLATAGGVQLGKASEVVTSAVMGLGLQFSETARVADVLTMGASATKTSIDGLGQGLSYAAPVAKSLGISLEGTVAILGQFAQGGIDASRAGTALNSILSQFADPASKFRLELANAGIITNNFEDALHQLAAAGPSGAKAINAVGQEAGPAMRAMLNLGMPALDELKQKLLDSEGSAAAMAKTMQDNLNGSLKSLEGAWQTTKNVLAEPVLPVLKQGIDQLAAALRGAVSDGTVAQFGAALGTAFKNGATWVKEFVGSIDFTTIIARAQQWADETAAAFSRVSEWATNTGNAVSLAWNVMAAGTNAVMSAIYAISSGFASVAQGVMNGIALLRDGLAKVTFGGLSDSFKAAADDARNAARGFGDAAQAMRDKASRALGDVATRAQGARDDFTALAGSMGGASSSANVSARSLESVAAALQKTAEANAAARTQTEKKAAADAAAKAALDAHNTAIAGLRAEYNSAVLDGNAQRMAEIQEQINQKMRDAPGAAQKAGEALLILEGAFTRLGVTSSAALKTTADNAKRDYEIIRTSGTATVEDLKNAFAAYAEKAIAANKGVASEALKIEAAIRGVKIETDEAGRSTVNLGQSGSSAMQQFGGAVRSAADAVDALGNKINYTSERAQALANKGQSIAAAFEQRQQDVSDSSITNNKSTTNPIDSVPSFETQEQADAWWEEWERQYRLQNDNVFRTGGQLGSYMKDMTRFEFEGEIKAMQLRNAMKVNGNASESTQTPLESMRSGQAITVNINTNGTGFGQVKTDAEGAETLRALMAELDRSKRNAGR